MGGDAVVIVGYLHGLLLPAGGGSALMGLVCNFSGCTYDTSRVTHSLMKKAR